MPWRALTSFACRRVLEGHLRDMVGHDKLGLGARDHIFRCDTWRCLEQGCAVARESNHCELSDN